MLCHQQEWAFALYSGLSFPFLPSLLAMKNSPAELVSCLASWKAVAQNEDGKALVSTAWQQYFLHSGPSRGPSEAMHVKLSGRIEL